MNTPSPNNGPGWAESTVTPEADKARKVSLQIESATRAAQLTADHWRNRYDKLEKERDSALARLAELESPIHTCSDVCDRPMCLMGRKLRAMEAENAELKSKLEAVIAGLDTAFGRSRS